MTVQMSKQRKRIEDVFTPRNETVNPRMYIPRDTLETALSRALDRQEHIMVFGEPGTGKSWLYKKVLGDDTSRYWTQVNLANAHRSKSIVSAIELALANKKTAQNVGYSEKQAAGIGMPGVAKADLEHQGQYEYEQEDEFLGILRRIRAIAGNRPAVLVLDNLEWVFDDTALLRELGSLIVLVDDPKYAELNVKMVIVGVPAGIREYFAKVPNLRTVSTRIRTLPEVAGLSREETFLLVERGFCEELQVELKPGRLRQLQDHVFYITLGIPLYVHDYCRELATVMSEDGFVYDPVSHRSRADKQWVTNSLDQFATVLANLMNSRQTRVGRKNQLLYTLGQLDEPVFDAQIVEQQLRVQFPQTTEDKLLNIGGMLSEMEAIDTSPLTRVGTTNRYRFTDPKFRMCMRAMLRKRPDESVEAALNLQ